LIFSKHEAANMRLIASAYCTQYKTEAKFYIDDAHPSGSRHLVVRYHQGQPEFAAAIPDDWTEQKVMDLLLWPMGPAAPYPAWEVSARVYGEDTLFDWHST
jgi:hypothetical protein